MEGGTKNNMIPLCWRAKMIHYRLKAIGDCLKREAYGDSIQEAVCRTSDIGIHSVRETARDLAELVKRFISLDCRTIVLVFRPSLISSCNCLSVKAS